MSSCMYMYMNLVNKMTREEADKIFAKDADGKFINLHIPAIGNIPELDLRGKAPLELSIDEIVALKKYSEYVYGQTLTNHNGGLE